MKIAKILILGASFTALIVGAGCESESSSADKPEEPATAEVEVQQTIPEEPDGHFGELEFGSSTLEEAEEQLGRTSELMRFGEDTESTHGTWRSEEFIGANELQLGFDHEGRLSELAASFTAGETLDQVIETIVGVLGPEDAVYIRYISEPNEAMEYLATWTKGPAKFAAVRFETEGGDNSLFGPDGEGILLVGTGENKGPMSDFLAMMMDAAEDVQDASTISQSTYIHEDLELDGFSYRVDHVEAIREVGAIFNKQKASPSAHWLIVRYSIENIGRRTSNNEPQRPAIEDADGRIFDPSNQGTSAVAEKEDIDLELSQFQPGIRKSRVAVFEVPDTVITDNRGFYIVADSIRIHLKLGDMVSE